MKKKIIIALCVFSLFASQATFASRKGRGHGHGGSSFAGGLTGGLVGGMIAGSASTSDSGLSRAEIEALRAKDQTEQLRHEQHKEEINRMRREIEQKQYAFTPWYNEPFVLFSFFMLFLLLILLAFVFYRRR